MSVPSFDGGATHVSPKQLGPHGWPEVVRNFQEALGKEGPLTSAIMAGDLAINRPSNDIVKIGEEDKGKKKENPGEEGQVALPSAMTAAPGQSGSRINFVQE